MSQDSKNSHPKVGRGADHPAWLTVPALCIPALGLAASLEAEGAENVMRSLSDSVLILIPAVAIAAAIARHLSARMAALAILVAIILDTAGFRSLAFEASRGWLHDSENPSWVTVVTLLLSAMISGALVLHRATLSRIVATTMCVAQIVVLLAFHQLLVIGPIAAEEVRETKLVRGLAIENGTFASLCGVAGRSCWMGNPDDLIEQVAETVPHSDGIVRLLEDTKGREALLHSWTEMILPSTDAESLMNVAIQKTSTDTALVMIDTTGPEPGFDAAKLAFGTLVVAFHQAWLTLGLLIIWRHRKLCFRGGQWRADA